MMHTPIKPPADPREVLNNHVYAITAAADYVGALAQAVELVIDGYRREVAASRELKVTPNELDDRLAISLLNCLRDQAAIVIREADEIEAGR